MAEKKAVEWAAYLVGQLVLAKAALKAALLVAPRVDSLALMLATL